MTLSLYGSEASAELRNVCTNEGSAVYGYTGMFEPKLIRNATAGPEHKTSNIDFWYDIPSGSTIASTWIGTEVGSGKVCTLVLLSNGTYIFSGIFYERGTYTMTSTSINFTYDGGTNSGTISGGNTMIVNGYEDSTLYKQ